MVSPSVDWSLSLVAKLYDMSNANEGILSNILIQEIYKFKATQSDCIRLAGDLLRGATMVHTPQMKLFACLEMLAGSDSECQFISSTTMLEVLSEFTSFDKTRCLVVLLGVIQRHRPRLGCPFSKFKDCEELAGVIVNLFTWFVTAITQLIEYDDGPETCQAIMATINVAQQYINDPFVFRMLQVVGKSKKIAGGPGQLKSDIADPLNDWKNSSVIFSKEIGELHSRFMRVFDPPDPLPLDYVRLTVQKLRRPGIRSLTSVLISFRVLMPAKEVAETIMMFGTLHGYNGDALLLDFLQACVLIMLEEHENHDSRHPSVLFFFAKLPKVLECFLQRQFITREIIQSSLSTIIEKFRLELDAVDFTLKDNSIKTLVGELCKLNVIKEDCAQKLQSARMDQIKPNIDLHQLIIKHEASNDKQVLMIMTTKKLKHSLETVWDNDKFFIMISKIVSSGVTLFDFCCSAYCVNGDLSELTRRIATLSRNAEMKKDPNKMREYLNIFTITFSLLARVSFNFPSLSIEELVAGKNGKDEANVKSAFYVWTKKMVKKIVPTKSKESGVDPDDKPGTSGEGIKTKEDDSTDVPMETEEQPVTVESVPEPLRSYCLNLAQRQVFWDCSRTSLSEILELVPKIGSVWLEEFKNERKSAEKSKLEFQNIIISFNELPVMLLCLAQWLESEPESHQRYLMSRCILEVLEDYVPDANAVSDKNVWSFVRSVVRLHLEEIQSAPPILHPVSIYLKSIATRTLPQCLRLQIPDLNILKDGWIYAQRQNWFNQRTLVLIDHMNRAKQHRSWIKLLVNNMMKLDTQDHMGKAIELICSTLLLDPVRSIIVALEILFDFLLSRDESTTDPAKPGLQHQSEYVVPLVKLVVQILMMGIWIVDMAKTKEGVKEPPEKIGRKTSEVEKSSVVELDEADRVDTLYKTIGNCINCMMKESMNAVYTPVTSIVFHILYMIARSPECRSKVLLIQMVPHEMLFRMAMLDPRMINVDVFRQFCDPSKTEHDQAQLQFVCLLRRSGGL